MNRNIDFNSRHYVDASHVPMLGRWAAHDGWFFNHNQFCDATNGGLYYDESYMGVYSPTLLTHRRVGDFQATYTFTGSANGGVYHSFVFHATSQDDYQYVTLNHAGGYAPSAGYISAGGPAQAVSATTSNLPTMQNGDRLWVRITSVGGTVTLRALVNNTSTPTETDWATAPVYLTTTSFPPASGGGMVGFANGSGAWLNNLTLQTPTSGGWNTQLVEHFAVDSTGFAPQGPTYDLAGNLTYDGNYAYAYDAWNRLVRVNNAWRETSGFGVAGVTLGPVQTGAVVDVMKYDGLNRRSVKAVQNTGHLDCTYHYYYDNQWRILEERNGSDGVLKQQVWAPTPGSGGAGYVDELVQVAVNADPINNPTMTWSPINPAYAPKAYWVMQDANYNVLGLVDATGVLKERYEYTPYGQRQVFISAGTNDPDCYVGQYISARVPTGATGVVQPYGLCEFGHQGLMHEEELGNGEVMCNRWRMRHVNYSWLQPEPGGYIDGISRRICLLNNPIVWVDHSGWEASSPTAQTGTGSLNSVQNLLKAGLNDQAAATLKDYFSPETQRVLRGINSLGIASDTLESVLSHTSFKFGFAFPINKHGCCCKDGDSYEYSAIGTEIILGFRAEAEVSNEYLSLKVTSDPQKGSLSPCPLEGQYFTVQVGSHAKAKGEVAGIGVGANVNALGGASLTPYGIGGYGSIGSGFNAELAGIGAKIQGGLDTNGIGEIAATLEHSAGVGVAVEVGKIIGYKLSLKRGCHNNSNN